MAFPTLTSALISALNRLPFFPYHADGVGQFKLGDALSFLNGGSTTYTGARTLYVDPVAGSDDNGGTSSDDALKTIEAAVLGFLPPGLGPPVWARGDDRTIHVVYTAGMSPIEEQVVLPPHAGAGILRILAEEEVLFSGVTLAGTFAAVDGKETQQTLTFNESLFTLHALSHTAFLRISNREGLSLLGAALDDFPIVDNAVDSVDIVAADPGIFCGFDIADGVAFDVVRPQITMSTPSNADAALVASYDACFTNLGGPCMISGFEFKAASDAAGTFHTKLALVNHGAGADVFWGPSVFLHRSTFVVGDAGETWKAPTAGPSTLISCILGPDSIDNLLYEASEFYLYNIDADAPNPLTVLSLFSCQDCLVSGLNVKESVGFKQDVFVTYLTMDVDAAGATNSSGRVLVYNGSQIEVYGLTVVNAGSIPAIALGSHGGYHAAAIGLQDGSRVSGSSGNTGVGVKTGVLTSMHMYGSTLPTLSGDDGDIQLGATTGVAWADKPQTDTTILTRYD